MKPVILMTVHRRYHELERSLRLLSSRKNEFSADPIIVVVWACPEIGRLWFFQRLLKEKSINHLIGRPRLDAEIDGCPTTYPESVSIRKGLEFIKEHFDDTHYVLMQAADIQPKEGIYRFVDDKMQFHQAVLFHLQNGCVHNGIWHTNFFATCLNDLYWPPVSPLISQDILERQWGLLLAKRQLPEIFESNNYEQKRFSHTHESEALPAFPFLPQLSQAKISLGITGYRPWYERVSLWLRSWF